MSTESEVWTATTRLLGAADLPAVTELLARDPIAGCLIASRVEAVGLEPRRLGGELWGYGEDRLEGICLAAANLVPLTQSVAAAESFAEQARGQGRRCSSIVGAAEAVGPMWDILAGGWGPAREVRCTQPLLAISGPPLIAADPEVRPVRPDELDVVLPACIAMFTEEVGISPLGADGGRSYRGRVQELIRSGRAYARIEAGQVVFKAELGALSSGACQIQGVWVHPDRRGQGLAAPGTAAVVQAALGRVAPVVSLYVNDYNAAARRAYRRVGFHRIDTFMSVLF